MSKNARTAAQLTQAAKFYKEITREGNEAAAQGFVDKSTLKKDQKHIKGDYEAWQEGADNDGHFEEIMKMWIADGEPVEGEPTVLPVLAGEEDDQPQIGDEGEQGL